MPPTPTFNPILLDLPEQLATRRLRLRAPRPGDGATVHASVCETLDDLRRFPASMPWAMAAPSVAASEDYARRSAAGWLLRTDFPFLGFLGGSDEHVVNCGLHRFDWERRVFEIGWWCRRRHQGQGFVTEAAQAVVQFAFEQLGARRVWCCADVENGASLRVAQRLGMQHEGTLRSEREDPDGTRRDLHVFALVR